ncbi:ABC transporter ATP-binding protein [Paroceanicella profunda]|uniref:ABC transporter ATP-binding protein n=1 Tax=Paroceanicella profunda TaxID=2579971 RepID=A0A5B8FQY7_9RHOB|nr:ABC transporter ATP-binding protein [Paroceanicella profunda]QDL90785.1 ABC transporter ATP-binding protein [Paroceanicella profunda]
MTGLLALRGLHVAYGTGPDTVPALRGVDLAVAPGGRLGLIGASGSGKTTALRAALGLLPPDGRITSGTVSFDGRDITAGPPRGLRGAGLAMVFQDARASLNPVRSAGDQIADALQAHAALSRTAARARALDLLGEAGLAEPGAVAGAVAHRLSGGQCQRVAIAAALACGPRLLVADEPATGLDGPGRAAVVALLDRLCRSRGMALVLISHDLRLAARLCDRVAVMEGGRVIEAGPAERIFRHPEQPRTRRLLAACPAPGRGLAELDPQAPALPPRRPAPAGPPLLSLRGLGKRFGRGGGGLQDISLDLAPGSCVGLTGESGAGKTTLARIIARLEDPDTGRILLDGTDLAACPARRFHAHPARGAVQLVFQDPLDSLTPRRPVSEAIAEPLRRLTGLRGAALAARVAELAGQVSLDPALLTRLPGALSGGQRARVGLARALAPAPRLLVLDEPTAALDMHVQAGVLHLLERLRAQLGLTCLLVSHDLEVLRLMCDRVVVMQAGRIVEDAPPDRLFAAPGHPHSQALIAAARG